MKTKILAVLVVTLSLFTSCDFIKTDAKSDSGVSKSHVTVKTNAEGKTIEQVNIEERLKRDNEPGSIKHLYIVSAYTGDVMFYSTVKGKVTSGSKRLSPKTVDSYNSVQAATTYGNYVNINGTSYLTDELLDDGGAYGESGNYLYWFDAQGNYQQYYPSGGTFIQISDRPLTIRKTNPSITIEEDKK
jgi:hypothetical protein